MAQHEVQFILEGKSVIVKLDDPALIKLQNDFTSQKHWITMIDVNGDLHVINSNYLTAVTTPKNHDLCNDSSEKFIELYKLGEITGDELRGHFGLGKKPVSATANNAGILFQNTGPNIHPVPYTISGNGTHPSNGNGGMP